MIAKCPACGREGKLPDDVKAIPRLVRCRQCRTRFELRPLEDEVAPAVLDEPLADMTAGLGIDAETDLDEVAIDVGVPKLNVAVSDSDEMPALQAPPRALPSEPWFYGVLDAWGALYLVGSLLMVGAAVLLVVYEALNVVGAVTLGSSGVILLTAAAVIFLVVDQARNVRQMSHRLHQIELNTSRRS